MILDAIVQSSRKRAADLLEFSNRELPPCRSLEQAILSRQPAVIGEVKYASPAGMTGAVLPPGPYAAALAAGGAAAISVLTEPTVFRGDPSFIPVVRRYVSLPILRKDILVDFAQIRESRAIGADAVLLIASVLGSDLLDFVRYSYTCGLEPVVEVACEEEVEAALATPARIIGINNRDLTTLAIDPNRSFHLAPQVRSAGRIAVAMSGIAHPDQVKAYQDCCSAVLIGSAIAAAADPEAAMERFVCM